MVIVVFWLVLKDFVFELLKIRDCSNELFWLMLIVNEFCVVEGCYCIVIILLKVFVLFVVKVIFDIIFIFWVIIIKLVVMKILLNNNVFL